MRFVCVFLFIAYSVSCIAQPAFPPPTGVYCSCGPTTGNGYGSVAPAIAAKPFVKGILVRVGWELLEPTDNNYNWSLLDTQINRAQQYSKKVSLGIGCGIQIPQWVFDNGAQRLISSSPFNDTIAVPWDTVYLTKWKEFITTLGSRYKNDTTIQLVYITHSTANGFEMQLPRVTTPTLAAVGYTDTKMADSWNEVVATFNTAFPNHYLTNDFHPVNNSDAVADTVYNYAVKTIGQRYGPAAWWWTQKNTTVYPAQYNIMKTATPNNKFGFVQFANSGTSDSAKFGAGGMPAALQLAINDGICYWEIWNEDILNTKFDSLLSNATCTYVSITDNEIVMQESLYVYPNPASNIVTINLPKIENHVSIIDVNGKCILNKHTKEPKLTFDVLTLNRGIYIIRITNEMGSSYRKLLLK